MLMRSPALLVIVTTLWSTQPSAQTPLSGSVSDGNGGPLLAGTVYHASGVLTVPSGATLTLQAGAILKMDTAGELSINGHLAVLGNATITGLADDSAGGDTNADGPSVGTPNSWRGLVFNAGATGSLNGLALRFGGRGGSAGIEVHGNGLSLVACSVSNWNAEGLDLNSMTGPITVAGCQFDNNTAAIVGVPLEVVPGFTNNSASGNIIHDSLQVSTANLTSGTTTVTTANLVSNVILAPPLTSIGPGATLVFDAGCIYKMPHDGQIVVDGALQCQGTAASRVALTDLRDDFRGGDSNKDGPGIGAPNWWRGLRFNATSGASQLTYTDLDYAGRFGLAAIEVHGAPISLASCRVKFSSSAGLDLNGTSMSGSISDCQFISNGAAVIGVPLDTVPRFTNTVAFGNSGVDSIILGGADILSGTTTITTQNTVGGVLVAPNGTFGTIASGATLDLRPGCIIKWNLDGGLTVNGTLSCIGTAGQPVVLTTTADDLHGGDTNEDGMSYVAPNTWRGVSFAPGSDSSQLEHCHVRGAGRSGTPALTIEANVTIRQSRVELSAADGISLAGSMAQPSIRDCVISGCGGVAINGLRWSSLKEFKDNQIIANTGNFAQITSPDIGASDRLRTHTVPNAVVVLASDPVFQAGDNLTIEPGLIIKMTLDRSIALSSGKLEIQGTGLQPVIFTSIADDDFGGDTNGDGPSWVAPGWWRGIQFDVGASSTKVNHVVIRGAGRTGVPGLSIDHPGVILTAPRVDTCTATGMQIGRLNGNIANAVVWNVGGIGLRVNGGGTLVGHATVAQCGGAGISADPAWFGAVVNSISWGNNGGNFGGIIAPRILYSNGDSTAAASNGNLNVDPMFVDMGTGDLRLQANSPCLDAADATAANTIFEDHQEGSRLADDDLSGQALPDMGAYERTRWAMTVQGLPFIGRHQIYSILGPPDALGVLLLAGPDHAPSLFSDYGWLLIGDANQVQVAGVFHVGFPFTGTMPNDPALVGMRFAVQAIILSVTNTTRGQFSQRYRGQIIR